MEWPNLESYGQMSKESVVCPPAIEIYKCTLISLTTLFEKLLKTI